MIRVIAALMFITGLLIASPQEKFVSTTIMVDAEGDLSIPRGHKEFYSILGNIVAGPANANPLQALIGGKVETNLGFLLFSLKSALQNNQEVVIYIDSFGGELSPTSDEILITLDEMTKNNIASVCIVRGYAISLAAAILSHCSDRYSVISGNLLWHSISYTIHGRINQSILETELERVKAENARLWSATTPFFSEEFFKKNFDEEQLVPAFTVEKEGQGFIKVIRSVVKSN